MGLPQADAATRTYFVSWLERFAGYVRAVDESARVLYGIRDWGPETCRYVSAEIAAAAARPAHIATILQRSGVLTCQVNSLEETLFCESSDPQHLLQDLSLLPLTTELAIPDLRHRSGLESGLVCMARLLEVVGQRKARLQLRAQHDLRAGDEDSRAVTQDQEIDAGAG